MIGTREISGSPAIRFRNRAVNKRSGATYSKSYSSAKSFCSTRIASCSDSEEFSTAARTFIPIGEDRAFDLYVDYPATTETVAPNAISVQLRGPAGFQAELRAVAAGRKTFPSISVTAGADAIRGGGSNGMRTYRVPANATMTIRWRD